jgi:hypothetical protein
MEEMHKLSEDSVARQELHRWYYAQFVDEEIKRYVLRFVGLERLLASKDPHLNDISLSTWDKLAGIPFRGMAYNGAEPGWKPPQHLVRRKADIEQPDAKRPRTAALSVAECCCIHKEAARQIIEEYTTANIVRRT